MADSQTEHLMTDEDALSDCDELREKKYEEGLKQVLIADDRDKAAEKFLTSIIKEQYKMERKKLNESRSRNRGSNHHRHYHHSHPSRDEKRKSNKSSKSKGRDSDNEKSKKKYSSKSDDHKSSNTHQRKNDDVEAKDNLSLSFGFKAKDSSKAVAKVFDVNEKADKAKNMSDENGNVKSVMDVDQSEDESKTKVSSKHTNHSSESIVISSAQDLVGIIPSTQRKLFDYDIDWDVIDKHKIIEKVMRDWLNDRFYEYLGQEELVLVDFVADLLTKRNSATKMVLQLKMVLSNDTEQFVMKMWRRLIFETLKIKHNV